MPCLFCRFLFLPLLTGIFFTTVFTARAEILVYKSSVNRWSSYLITDGAKTPWVAAPRGTKLDAYFLFELDGTNKILPPTLMTNRGQILIPSLIYVDHKRRIKQLKGRTQANEANNTEQFFYGRARGTSGQRIFRILYQQWEPNGDGSYDTSVSMNDGLCQVLNIGGGLTGYYAPKLLGQGWRLDSGYYGNGPAGPYQDTLQLKYLANSSDLELALTQAINDQSLSQGQAFNYVLENLLPAYTVLDPDVR